MFDTARLLDFDDLLLINKTKSRREHAHSIVRGFHGFQLALSVPWLNIHVVLILWVARGGNSWARTQGDQPIIAVWLHLSGYGFLASTQSSVTDAGCKLRRKGSAPEPPSRLLPVPGPQRPVRKSQCCLTPLHVRIIYHNHR